MEKKIYFDMDGTIADLYGVAGWLEDLRASKTRPYEEAKPLVDMDKLADNLNRLKADGYEIGIISWLSKSGTEEYNQAVALAKLVWLEKHLQTVTFDEIHIVAHGTPKETLGRGILFDDEAPNRKNWGEGAYEPKNIFQVLKNLR